MPPRNTTDRRSQAEPDRPDDGPPGGTFAIDGHPYAAPPLAPGLHVVATPIGNLADVTLRALATLAAADRILCEDTRVTSRLLARYAIRRPLQSYHEHNAARLRPRLLERLAAGDRLALVSDAGTPLISDPGYKLVREARERGLAVTVVPGPSALTAALVASGLPSDRVLFAGFLPAKSGQRRNALKAYRTLDATIVAFVSPRQAAAALADIGAVLGNRDVAVCRELTKIHEETIAGPVAEVAAEVAGRGSLKGEITVVISPPAAGGAAAADEIDRRLTDLLGHMAPSEAAREVARALGAPRRAVSERALALRPRAEPGDEP